MDGIWGDEKTFIIGVVLSMQRASRLDRRLLGIIDERGRRTGRLIDVQWCSDRDTHVYWLLNAPHSLTSDKEGTAGHHHHYRGADASGYMLEIAVVKV